jgi:hypothetical protein
MIHLIKKIFQNKIDESVHWPFVRFSRGIFEGKAALSISRNDKIKLSSSCDLANDIVLFVALLAKKVNASGIIMSRGEIKEFEGIKKKGLFVYNINQALAYDQLEHISKNAFAMLLDCEAEGISLKTKKTLPRPSPKGTKKVNDKFCVAQLDIKFWPSVREEFLFDLPEGKKYNIVNKYEITEIVLSENEKDSEKLRLLAKRKGKVTRKSIVDGKEIIQEKGFIA